MRRIGAALLLLAAATGAVAGPVECFFGDFRGTVSAFGRDARDERVVRVRIGPHERGFVVHWEAVITEAPEGSRRRQQTVHFLPTARADLYQSGMRQGPSGHAEPFDPLSGDPYMWARVVGDTLRIYLAALKLSPGRANGNRCVRTRTDARGMGPVHRRAVVLGSPYFFLAAHGLQGPHPAFLAAHGLQPVLTFLAAQGLQGLHPFFFAAQGLHAPVS